jgi:hypothetical protein
MAAPISAGVWETNESKCTARDISEDGAKNGQTAATRNDIVSR